MCLLLAGAQPARAQADISLASLVVELWPEFDQPATLVILDGELDATAALPVEVTVRIPAAAGQPYAVAVQDEAGSLLNAPYTTTLAGDDIAITLLADRPAFRVEYYDPALNIQGEVRDYAFGWKTDYAVRAVSVRVQQPYGARNLKLDPGFTPEGVGDFGLSYYTTALGQLAAGQSLAVSFSYARSTSTLSAELVSAAAPSESTTPAAASSTALSPWLIAGAAAGLVLIAGGAVYYWRGLRSSRPRAIQSHRRRRPTEARASPLLAVAEGSPARAESRFCTQCGQPLQPGDRFCRNCGTKVRE